MSVSIGSTTLVGVGVAVVGEAVAVAERAAGSVRTMGGAAVVSDGKRTRIDTSEPHSGGRTRHRIVIKDKRMSAITVASWA